MGREIVYERVKATEIKVDDRVIGYPDNPEQVYLVIGVTKRGSHVELTIVPWSSHK